MGWTKGTLRISSEVLSVVEIEEALALTPTHSVEKGSKASMRNPASMTRQASVWMFESGLAEGVPVEDHVEYLLEIAEQHADQLRLLRSNSKIDLFLGLSAENGQGGFHLGNGLLGRLAALGIDLTLDLYEG